jgi:protein-disulfide isomerase
MGKYLTPVAVILGAVVIGGAVIWSGGTRGTNPNDPNAAPTVNIEDVATDTSPTVGDPGAPTTVAVYYDYQCPFCKQFELAVIPQLMENYVTTGKTKIIYKDFHFLGEDSMTAAVFGRALYDLYPDQFQAWFIAMANAQDEEGDEGFGDLASIQELTRGIGGIDVDRVTAQMEEKRSEYEAAIQADYDEGTRFGINGTPSIIVGDQLLTGMAPEQFYQAIAAELDEQLQ